MLRQETDNHTANGIPWKIVDSPLRLWNWVRRCFQAAAADLEDAEQEIRELQAHIKTLEKRLIQVERLIDTSLQLSETGSEDSWYWNH
jgi:predicted neutral ceramidase superfamily lipid hydrolase